MQHPCTVASLWLEPDDLLRSQNQLLADSIARLAEENASLVNEFCAKPSIRRKVTDRSAAFGVFGYQKSNSKVEDDISSIATTSAPSSTSASLVSLSVSDDDVEVQPRTTVMLQNLASTLTRDQLVLLMNEKGFAGEFDLVYAPIDLNSNLGFGYAFVNFCSASAAEQFMSYFDGVQDELVSSSGRGSARWNGAHQGFECLVARYRNSPVMHPDVPDAAKPAMFDAGKRVPFPLPTKKLKAPKLRRSN